MLFSQGEVVRGGAIGLVCAAAGAVVAIPFLLWGSGKAPEFFGAFAAAIVAAVAVVLGAYYQATLTRQRDDEIRRQEQISEATDLCYWLNYAATEMEFIANVLLGMGQFLAREHQSDLDWPIERYREVVSSQFMDELLLRAKAASRLPTRYASSVAQILYECFTVVDRTYRLRGVPDSFRATSDRIDKHEQLARIEVQKLKDAHELLLAYIIPNSTVLKQS